MRKRYLFIQGDEVNPKAYPLADAELTKKILDLVQQAVNYKQLRKGANEGKYLTHSSTSNIYEYIIIICPRQPS